jgi:hypothetical protein
MPDRKDLTDHCSAFARYRKLGGGSVMTQTYATKGRAHTRQLVFGIFAIVLLGIAIGVIVPTLHARAVTHNCAQQLKSLAAAITMYRGTHFDKFPHDLSQLQTELNADFSHMLECPGVDHRAQHADSTEGIDDYVYINWSEQPRGDDWQQGTYPLMYDRRMSNHSGRGVNVVLVDQEVFFDEGANWLKAFAQSHPDVQMPLPQ